jgi:hypothetical protein
MRNIFVLSLLLLSGISRAQKIADPRPFAAAITAADLQKHLYIVAGKDFEGRETATEGQRKAAAYIEEQFRSLGLLPGNKDKYQLDYPVFQDSILNSSVIVNETVFRLNEDFSLNPSSDHEIALYSSEVVFAGYGLSDSTRDDYKGLDAKGRIVLVLNGEPSGPSQAAPGQSQSAPGARSRRNATAAKQEAAQKNGAVALLIIQGGFPRKASGDKGPMYLSPYKKNILPDVFIVSDKIAEAIMGTDYAGARTGNPQPKSYTINTSVTFYKATLPLQSSDVLGYLEGTDLKDQLVVISAHYDHLGKTDSVIYYGADDDGSGTVSVLELAQAFAKAAAAGRRSRRSILFLANSGEEKGLWGSAYYADHPVYPLEKTTVDLNIDMIGRIDPNRHNGDSTNYVYVVGDDKLSSDLKPISEGLNKKYTKLELDYKFNDPNDPLRIYFRSDHYNFARKGVPIIFYFDGIHNDYHRPTDTPDKINYGLLEKRAKLVFYTAWEMANRDSMLKRDIPLK